MDALGGFRRFVALGRGDPKRDQAISSSLIACTNIVTIGGTTRSLNIAT